MASTFLIREYRPEDRERCRSLWRELTELHREIYEDPNIGGENPEDYFDKHLARVGPDRLWVAVHKSQVIGLVGLVFEEAEAEVEPIIVSESYRRKGIGKKLIERAVSEACRERIKFINIEPVARNIDAIKFLYKQGFKNLGHIQLFMDFSKSQWKPGPKIHECEFNF